MRPNNEPMDVPGESAKDISAREQARLEQVDKSAAIDAILGGSSTGQKALDGLTRNQAALLKAYLEDQISGGRKTLTALSREIGISDGAVTGLKQSRAWDMVNRWITRKVLDRFAESKLEVAEAVIRRAVKDSDEAAKMVLGDAVKPETAPAMVAPIVIQQYFGKGGAMREIDVKPEEAT